MMLSPTAAWADSIRTTERRARRWVLPENVDDPSALPLASKLKVPRPVAQILCARGISTTEGAYSFLFPSLDELHRPSLMYEMERAVDRIRTAIRAGQKIEIHGDYDVDGTTSTVILKTAIQLAGGEASYSIPHRLKDGYGIRTEAIERAYRNGVGLIISVDTGIRADAAVRHALELGIDVIITDHHLPEAALPPAYAVLNPNRPDCGYPEKTLCGAGVTFKLAQALLESQSWPKEKLERILASFLKLVAIATIADVVPLTGENRVMVWHGLRGLTDIRNPGLRALLGCAGIAAGAVPTSYDVGFRIAPRINAAGRMASADEVIELFLTRDEARAREIAERLSSLNANRQGEEAAIIEQILTECESSAVDTTAPALVFCAEGWHRGVLGIVASRLVERFCRPVFVLSTDNGETSGSGRSIAAFHLLEALEAMGSLFVKYGGHKQAAGVTLLTEKLEEFRSGLAAYARSRLTPEDFVAVERIDCCVHPREITDDLWKGLGMLGPFGSGNPAPVFAACGLEVVKDPMPMKEKHLRFVAGRDGRHLNFKAFNFAARAPEVARGSRIDVAFQMEKDDYFGWGAIVRDVRRAEGGQQ